MLLDAMSLRMTPLIKCVFLFLLVFTSEVLTSGPNEGQNSKNGIPQPKSSHYVRTFTKYHHRRTTEANNWPVTEHGKTIIKRSVDVLNSKELIENFDDTLIQFDPDQQSNIITSEEKVEKPKKFNKSSYLLKKDRNGTEYVTTRDGNEVKLSNVTCLYKIQNVAYSSTPSYKDEENSQFFQENEYFDAPGHILDIMSPTGDMLKIENCTNPHASCYILWHQNDDGNTTILGQGCWRSSPSEGQSCNACTKTPQLPGTKFCCCTQNRCNADFLSIKDEVVTPRASLATDKKTEKNYLDIVIGSILLAILVAIMAFVVWTIICLPKDVALDENSTGRSDLEKGNPLSNGPDALATGLLCVDNLTLIEHIGSGKFGSVWRGRLGAKPVAVKLYSSSHAWQKEAIVYSLPHMAHNNIVRYFGSDSRPTLTGGSIREYLIVLELCASTLRQRLERSPLSWLEMAHLSHGIASAVAHLHSSGPSKPCIVHRDINTNNVLISRDGHARLADFGLTQVRQDTTNTRISEAGTLRYLAPEALEGALDLSAARAALCAVDVYALGLVLWEVLWRTGPAHRGTPPAYSLPYAAAGLNSGHTIAQIQNLVCRNKVRPPLPKGPVPEGRALKLCCDTCEECWDHDAEARLTAVCVEERMSELKQMLSTPGPVIHDNNLHPHNSDSHSTPPENDKNSNCLQNCDVTTPLLYTQPHIGRNPCIERNTHTTQTNDVELIQKSLKDAPITLNTEKRVQNQEQCLSVARVNPNRVYTNDNHSDVRSYQRPLDYVPNDVTVEDRVKVTNLQQDVKVEKPKWGIKKFFDKKFKKETEVKLESCTKTTISVVDKNKVFNRPSNLVLDDNFYMGGPCLSPPNRTLSPTMMLESNLNRENKVFGFKEMPKNETDKQVFAVIVPKVKIAGSTESLNKNSLKFGNSESDDSSKKLGSRILNSGSSSRASINLELQYIDTQQNYDITDCSSSEDEHLMLLSENGSKITMQSVKNDILKETITTKQDFVFNKNQNKYNNFENEYSEDKENSYTGDNPVYQAFTENENGEKIKRQRSLEEVSEIFNSSSDVHLLNPAGRVKTPGDIPVAVRRARRDRALQKGRANEANRLSLYDDRMMFGNSL